MDTELLDVSNARRSVIQNNYRLIWLNINREESDNDYRQSITELRRFVDTFDIFTDIDQCIDFITDSQEEKLIMIVSSEIDQYLISYIHDLPQLNLIYIFCKNKSLYEPWMKTCPKIKCIFTRIESIYPSLLRRIIHRCEEDSVLVSFVSASDTTNNNLNEFDQTFMYTQILKEILLEMNYDKQSITDLANYWRSKYAKRESNLKTIVKFEQGYFFELPVWWYTHSIFLYSILNQALRTLNVDVILKMAFFIRDLHRNIEQLHSEQFCSSPKSSLLVYRGQGLSKADFEKMQKKQGGLMSFNAFLSTSTDRDISYLFAETNEQDPELIGVLFEITIDDTSISSAPFADIEHVSYYSGEKEILFSMHTIFRIGEIKQIDGNNQRLWQVKLTLTNDNDPQLAAITEQLRLETRGHTGWLRLVKLLSKLGHFSKAEAVCQSVLNQTTDDQVKGHLYHFLGSIKDDLGDHVQACSLIEKALEIYQRTLPSIHPDFITAFNNIAAVYEKMGDHSKAFSYLEKLVRIRERILPPNHPDLAASYNNLGFSLFQKREDSTALSYYEKALAIYQKILPANHPSLSFCYNNLASVYDRIGEYDTALSYLEIALDIDQKILPSEHPELAEKYNNIGWVYSNMQEYSKAIPYYERAIEIAKHSFSDVHPTLRTYTKNLESARNKLL